MNQVDHLFTGGTVVTMDRQAHVYRPGAVAVCGTEIVAVGPESEILATYTATETFTCTNQIVMPGIVDAHTHVPMSLLRGLADDLRLDVWLHGYILPMECLFAAA